MKKLSSSKLVLAMLFAVISISANAQLKMSSNGYLTFGPTSTYNDGTKDYNITLRGNIWLAGPNVGHFLQRSEERRVGKECRSRWSPYH